LIYEKDDFTEHLKNYLVTDLKIILLDHENNYVKNSRIMNNAAKNFDIVIRERPT